MSLQDDFAIPHQSMKPITMNEDELFRSLVAVTAIDGGMSAQELRFLHTIRKRLNLPEDCILSALQDAKQGKRQVFLPKNERDRNIFLELLVQAAYADGTVSPEKLKMLRVVADKLGVPPAELERKIPEISEIASDSVSTHSASYHSSATKRVDPLSNGIQVSEPRHPRRGQAASVRTERKCPKCGYRANSPDDSLLTGDGGRGECPACGIVLARYLALDKKHGNRRTPSLQRIHSETSGGIMQNVFSLLIVAFMLYGVYSIFSQAREQHKVDKRRADIFASVYRISNLAQAQKTARAQKKPIMFLYSREHSQCPQTREANFYLMEKMHDRAVIVFVEFGKRDWAQLPCFVQREFRSKEIGTYIPRAVFVNSIMNEVVATTPYPEFDMREKILQNTERQLASHLYR